MSRYIDAYSIPYRCEGAYLGGYAMQTDIDAIPTADVQKVKHGRWKSTGFYGFRCSVCGEHVCMREDHMANYCPECGAKMDAKEDDN